MSLQDYTEAEIKAEIARREAAKAENRDYSEAVTKLKKLSTKGIWKVTSDGDEEGRTTKTFGTFEGDYGELALNYGGAALYSLTIEPALNNPSAMIPTKEAHVCVASLVGWGGGNAISEGQCRAISDWLYDKYFVRPSNFFKSVVISKRETP